MNVEERIAIAAAQTERNQRLNRMRELLEAEPLSYDNAWTPETSKNTLMQRINDQQELIGLLANSLAQLTTTVLELRANQGKQQAQIMALTGMLGVEQADAATGLVGFDKPKIELN